MNRNINEPGLGIGRTSKYNPNAGQHLLVLQDKLSRTYTAGARHTPDRLLSQVVVISRH